MAKKRKPQKPYPDFPLYAHSAGVWAKRIRGRVHYFGPWNKPEDALQRYLERRDYIKTGQPAPSDGITLDELANRFFGNKAYGYGVDLLPVN